VALSTCTVKLRYNGLLGTIQKSLLYSKSVISKLGLSSLNIYRRFVALMHHEFIDMVMPVSI